MLSPLPVVAKIPQKLPHGGQLIGQFFTFSIMR